MDQYEAFVLSRFPQKSRVGMTENLIDASLQFLSHVLKDEPIMFHTHLMPGLVPWRRSANNKLLPDDVAKTVPKSWSEVKLVFESTYLSADAVAHSVEDIVTIATKGADSATAFLNKHRDKFGNFRRQADRTAVSE